MSRGPNLLCCWRRPVEELSRYFVPNSNNYILWSLLYVFHLCLSSSDIESETRSSSSPILSQRIFVGGSPNCCRSDNEVSEEITIMKPNESIERSSLQQHRTPPGSPNEKVSSNTSARMQEKGPPVKSGKPCRQTGPNQQAAATGKSSDRSLVSPMHSGNRHKPWPSRKANELEEAAAKHTSTDPHSLHRAKGDGVQEKALSIGVFDWERLEKLEKQADQGGGSLGNASILVLSSPSGRGIVQRKQSPIRDPHRSSSAGDRRSKLLKENRSGRATGSPDHARTPPSENSSVRHDHEKIKSRDAGSVGIYHKMSQSADYDSSSLREAESFDRCEEHCYACNLHPRFSFDSAIENSVIVGDLSPLVSKNRINEPAETEVPATRTKIATTPRRDLSPQRLFAAGLNRLRSSSVREGSSVNRGSYSVPLSSASDNKHEKFTDKSFEPFPVLIVAHRSGQDEAKAATGPARRDLSPHRLLAAGLNRLRSNSVRERPSGQQTNQTATSAHSTEDHAAGNNGKGRQSPLRRMFDPLLKPRNRMQFSGPVASLASHQGSELSSSERLHIRDELKSAKGPPRSSSAGINPSTDHISEPRCSVRDESCMASTRQAVLELAWKNGLPLFMFSSDNNDILAATIGKRNVSEQKGYECLYTMFTAHEVKKRGGAWMSQGSKSKKQGLVYNVVGHIRASSLQPAGFFPQCVSGTREFILFGSELIPTTEKHVTSFSSELAAIVIKAPGDVLPMMGSAADVTSCCQSPETSIVAVLPKGVHGLSSEGEPSPLIERWKSGGSCDCGGWDEGCTLSVLTERRGCTSTQACNTDGAHRIELFAQASEARASKHAFSMDSFGEGAYTVEFRASVASVQAFAICVAILHSRKPTDLSGLQCPVPEAQNLQEDTFPGHTEMVSAKTEGEGPANYVPEPPPPSPGGRA